MPDVSPNTGAASQVIFNNLIQSEYEKKTQQQVQKTEQDLSDVQVNEQVGQRMHGKQVAEKSATAGLEETSMQEQVTGKKAGPTSKGIGQFQGSIARGVSEEDQYILQTMTSTSPTKKPGLSPGWTQLLNAEEMSIKSSQGVNLIAIMSEVMILQAKSNQDFFSALWQEASAAMNMEAELAPVVAKATLQAGYAQAAQSKAEANNALVEGIVNIAMFAVTVGSAGAMSYAAAGEEAALDEAANVSIRAAKDTKEGIQTEGEIDESGSGAKAGKQAEEENAGPEDDLSEDADKVTSNDQQDASQAREAETAENEAERTSQTKNAEKERAEGARTSERISSQTTEDANKARASRMQQLGRAAKKIKPKIEFLSHLAQQGMVWQGLAQGITGIATYVYKNRIAAYQVQAAQWQAIEKMGDIEVQFFGQAFGRAEGMSQQAQQNINTALQLLEGIVSAITQTVSSGFSNI